MGEIVASLGVMLNQYNASFKKTMMMLVMVSYYIIVISILHNDNQHYSTTALMAQPLQLEIE